MRKHLAFLGDLGGALFVAFIFAAVLLIWQGARTIERS